MGAAARDVGQDLRAVAANLGGIAERVGHEAAAATEAIRRSADEARETAALAAELDTIAALLEHNVRLQSDLIEQARREAEANGHVLAGLAGAADAIGSTTAIIADIADRSRLLSLNARIEAARTGDAGRGFDVVANEMKVLAQQTRDATRQIDDRTQALQGDVGSTRALFDAAEERVRRTGAVAEELVSVATRQRSAAADVAGSTRRTMEEVEAATEVIGRVASIATTVKVIARQIVRAADRID